MLFSWRPITERDRALPRQWLKSPMLDVKPIDTTKEVAGVLALSLFAVLVACTDTVAPSGHPGIPPIAAMQECPPDQPDCDNTGPGGGINPNNSWVSGDVTITTSATEVLSTPVYDEATGTDQTNFSASAMESLHVDAGYGYSGQTIVNTAFTDPVDPATSSAIQVTSAGLNSDVLTESNSQSQQIQDAIPSNASTETPMDIVGSTQNGDVTAGAIVDLLDTTTVVQSSSVDGGQPDYRAALANAAAKAEKGQPQTVSMSGAQLKVELTKTNNLQVSELAQPEVDAAGSTASMKHFTLYAKQGHRWMISEIHTEVDAKDSGRQIHQEHVIRFKHLKAFRNRVADSLRRVARPTTDWIPLQPSSGTVSATLVACGDECNGGSGSISAPVPMGATPPCANDVVAQVNGSGNVNLLYQHGFFSSAMTWCGSPSMDDYLRTHFVVGNEIRHTLLSRDLYENQAADLSSRVRNDVASGYAGPYAFIGHSNGGIISRASAQTLVSQGNYVRGVITVSTPHDGAALARLGKIAFKVTMAVPLLASKIACDLFAHAACTLEETVKGESSSGLVTILDPILTQNGGVITEMTPHNPYYSNLNAGYEPFPKAAVIDQAWDKWTPFRVYGDATCTVLYSQCDGRHVVAYVDKTYHRFLKCAVIGGIFSFVLPAARPVATACALSAARLKGFDLLYKRITVGNDHGDGVVAVHSQRYPNLDAGGQFLVLDSDSHVGVTRSTKQTGPAIASALSTRLNVPIQ